MRGISRMQRAIAQHPLTPGSSNVEQGNKFVAGVRASRVVSRSTMPADT